MPDLSSFELVAGTYVVVNVVLDLRSSGILLGSANVSVTWDPAVLTLTAYDAVGTSPVTASENAGNIANGVYRLSVSSTPGVTGRVVLRRLVFFAWLAGTNLPTQLVTTALDANTADTFASVLRRVLSVSLPLVSR